MVSGPDVFKFGNDNDEHAPEFLPAVGRVGFLLLEEGAASPLPGHGNGYLALRVASTPVLSVLLLR